MRVVIDVGPIDSHNAVSVLHARHLGRTSYFQASDQVTRLPLLGSQEEAKRLTALLVERNHLRLELSHVLTMGESVNAGHAEVM